MTDALLTIGPDGGNISVVNGRTAMTDSLETLVSLCLWGGNVADTGGDSTKALQWWGNFLEDDSKFHLRSRTQALINSLPLIPINLLRIEDAAVLDLSVITDLGIAKSIATIATIPAINSVLLGVQILGDNELEFSTQYLRKRAVNT